MIIVLKQGATQEQVSHVLDIIKKLGLTAMVSEGTE